MRLEINFYGEKKAPEPFNLNHGDVIETGVSRYMAMLSDKDEIFFLIITGSTISSVPYVSFIDNGLGSGANKKEIASLLLIPHDTTFTIGDKLFPKNSVGSVFERQRIKRVIPSDNVTMEIHIKEDE